MRRNPSLYLPPPAWSSAQRVSWRGIRSHAYARRPRARRAQGGESLRRTSASSASQRHCLSHHITSRLHVSCDAEEGAPRHARFTWRSPVARRLAQVKATNAACSRGAHDGRTSMSTIRRSTSIVRSRLKPMVFGGERCTTRTTVLLPPTQQYPTRIAIRGLGPLKGPPTRPPRQHFSRLIRSKDVVQ